MSSYLTLDPSWAAPSSCLASTAYYYMVVRTYSAGIIFSEMFGAPTPLLMSADPTGPCIPPGFTTETPYMTDGPCPTGYSRLVRPAPHFRVLPQAPPSGAFKFACHGETYGCLATANKGDVWTGTRTDIALTPNTQAPETHTAYPGESLWAWGIKFIRRWKALLTTYDPKTPTATESPTSTAKETGATATGPVATVPTASITNFESTSPPRSTAVEPESVQSTPSQISPGATAGITVGAMAGALVLALVAWLLYRRKRRQRQPAVQQHDPQYHPTATCSPQEYYNAQPPYPQSKAELGPGGERYMPAELQ
ncbi:hypothetical protein PG997_011781 [Apiospora hydei]|uniref:Uncharacterized protein n=1 Tax=Apiospora hydei TaxID=1337664 RepID=A0ABR1V1G4_9PEZI